ncbi:hypothetical protein M404DRAFT_837333 [Pisolithus tinctorius Marx 270]|uniref:Uncharacterized protein n=1 Tax=Pisolithus tinctorius Marx 270 TaxID=870435 RepID=A0A0C3PRI5_PISTI|nr:hypothetical protein M404DRAFT_837333 [Pisolithus tinctorius Marx 270]
MAGAPRNACVDRPTATWRRKRKNGGCGVWKGRQAEPRLRQPHRQLTIPTPNKKQTKSNQPPYANQHTTITLCSHYKYKQGSLIPLRVQNPSYVQKPPPKGGTDHPAL